MSGYGFMTTVVICAALLGLSWMIADSTKSSRTIETEARKTCMTQGGSVIERGWDRHDCLIGLSRITSKKD